MRTYRDFCRAAHPVERTEKRAGDLVIGSREVAIVPEQPTVVQMRGRRRG